MYSHVSRPDDLVFPDTWAHMKCEWEPDKLLNELIDLAPKDCDGNLSPIMSKPRKHEIEFIHNATLKIQNQFVTSSRKIESKQCVGTFSCTHVFYNINEFVFVDLILNKCIKSYTNYAYEFSNQSMVNKYHAKYADRSVLHNKARQNKAKRKEKIKKLKKQKQKHNLHLKQKRKGRNPLHFKEILFGPSTCYTICNKCNILFFIKSRKLRDLFAFIQTALRSQYIEFEYVLNTMTWFVCKLLLNPLIRNAVFNDNTMKDLYLFLWHKLWLENKYYFTTQHDIKNTENEKKPLFTNVFINILPTMFYNMSYILTLVLVNLTYDDINERFIKNKSIHWQRILAFVLEQTHFIRDQRQTQSFINQDEDVYYNLLNIVLHWIIKYESINYPIHHWFNMDGRKNEAIAHYEIRNLHRFYSDNFIRILMNNMEYIHQTVNNSIKVMKALSKAEKICMNTICQKSKLWLDKEKGRVNIRKLYICEGCKLVYYCCRKCQKYDWSRNNHKYFCKLLRIQYSAYFVVSRS